MPVINILCLIMQLQTTALAALEPHLFAVRSDSETGLKVWLLHILVHAVFTLHAQHSSLIAGLLCLIVLLNFLLYLRWLHQ